MTIIVVGRQQRGGAGRVVVAATTSPVRWRQRRRFGLFQLLFIN